MQNAKMIYVVDDHDQDEPKKICARFENCYNHQQEKMLHLVLISNKKYYAINNSMKKIVNNNKKIWAIYFLLKPVK